MPSLKIPVIIDDIDLKVLMTYFETDNPRHAVSRALKWAVASAKPARDDEHPPEPTDDFTTKSTATLEQIVAYTFPDSIQERIETLLDKKREGVITESQMKELEQRVLEVQLKTVEKARAMAALN
jgi:hypothetical protein